MYRKKAVKPGHMLAEQSYENNRYSIHKVLLCMVVMSPWEIVEQSAQKVVLLWIVWA